MDLTDWDDRCHYWPLGAKKGYGFVINEAHGLHALVVRRLLVLLDPPSPRALWVFTTTLEGQLNFIDGIDAPPLLSRCARIGLTSRGVAALFAERAKAIAGIEGLDGKALTAYVELVNSLQGNMRAVLQAVETGQMALPSNCT